MPYDSYASLIGHISEQPEVKMAGDTPYTKFSLAVETRHKVKGEWQKITTWWRCTLFGKGAEWLAKDAKKGSLVHVRGTPYEESYTDKDGNKKTQPHKMHCDIAQCLDRREKAGDDAAPVPRKANVPAKSAVDDSDLAPF